MDTRKEVAASMRKAGSSYQEIAEALGVSKSTAYAYVAGSFERMPQRDITESLEKVVKWTGLGYKDREIAEKMGISVRHVRRIRSRAKVKKVARRFPYGAFLMDCDQAKLANSKLVDKCHKLWIKRIISRAERERFLGRDEIEYCWFQALNYAISAYKYGGATGFEMLVNRAWSSNIVESAKAMRQTQESPTSIEDLEFLLGLAPEHRGLACDMIAGVGDPALCQKHYLSQQELADLKTKIGQSLV